MVMTTTDMVTLSMPTTTTVLTLTDSFTPMRNWKLATRQSLMSITTSWMPATNPTRFRQACGFHLWFSDSFLSSEVGISPRASALSQRGSASYWRATSD